MNIVLQISQLLKKKPGLKKKVMSITNEISDRTIADYYKKYFSEKIIQIKRIDNVNINSKKYKNFPKPSNRDH